MATYRADVKAGRRVPKKRGPQAHPNPHPRQKLQPRPDLHLDQLAEEERQALANFDATRNGTAAGG